MESFKNKKILVTGHTGFKGSWLCLLLKKLGADLTGIGLKDGNTRHFNMLNLNIKNYFIDINNFNEIKEIFSSNQFDLVIHLAAQSLVKLSYKNPLETFNTNIIGTANILECCKKIKNLKGVLCITSDKCYKNLESLNGYKEEDLLGGSDPYSASKSCAELVAYSYKESFYKSNNKIIATARAGNVIGGGDWAKDRLIVDIMNHFKTNNNLHIRNPKSVRPWQHVLDCIHAYILIANKILCSDFSIADAWNIGPSASSIKNVEEVIKEIESRFGRVKFTVNPDFIEKETNTLILDSSKIRENLLWKDLISFEEAIDLTCQWYIDYFNGECSSEKQVEMFLNKI